MSLDPLADYLEPQFGNVYSYGLPHAGSLEVQEWTDKLRQAVTQYLVRETSNEDYAAFLDELSFSVPTRARRKQVDFIIDIAEAEAWEIAQAFHLAAVKAVPTLEELIGELETWPDAGLQEDVGYWLDAHASEVQLLLLAKLTNHPGRNANAPWYRPEPTGWDFTRHLTPTELLGAWNDLTGSATSDLTDDEWQLLASVLPAHAHRHGSRARTEGELLALRHAFDGMRYKFDQGIPWTRVPRRYGVSHNVYQRYVNYRDRGDFAQMYQALQEQPGAERVRTWLEEVTREPMRDRRGQ